MNERHYPAGSKKGGQFAPKGISEAFGIDSNVSSLQEKYGINDDVISRQKRIDEYEVEESTKPSLESYSPEIQNVTKQIFSKSVMAEQNITRDIKQLAEIVGGELKGLEHVLKTPESIANKLYTNMTQWGNTMQEAIRYTDDNIRYTMTFDDENMANGVDDVLKTLMNNGHKVEYMQNRYLPSKVTGKVPEGYKDINCKMVSPTGEAYEIQFSTKEAYSRKNNNEETGEKGSHYYYKIANSLKNKQKERGLTSEEEERLQYASYMNEKINGVLKSPKNIEKIIREEYR